MSAQLAGRYKFLDAAGKLKGDVELDLDWENWGKSCSDDDLHGGKCVSPGDYRVVIDAAVFINGVSDASAQRGHDQARVPGHLRHPGRRQLPPPGRCGAPGRQPQRGHPARRPGLRHRRREDRLAARRPRRGSAHDDHGRRGVPHAALRAQPGRRRDPGGLAVQPQRRRRRRAVQPDHGAAHLQRQHDPPGPRSDQPDLPPGYATPDQPGQALSPVNQGDYRSHYVLFMLGATAWF